MDKIIWGICAFGLIALGYVIVGTVLSYDTEGEDITEKQYRIQSLQYLEDIRNSNDELLELYKK